MSWNNIVATLQLLGVGHAPRERVSWNFIWDVPLGLAPRHAPRERVSWNIDARPLLCCPNRHAPRERVSWNCFLLVGSRSTLVTLHVSVWVEIELADQVAICDVRSRSTWACELKYIMNNYGIQLAGHAPRERVSWNGVWRRHNRSWKVTLHVSVWVEIASILFNGFSCCSHAPRERVSWNASKRPLFWDQLRHAPRERVSWNRPWWHLWRPIRVTLHVSVWVEIHH